MLIKTHVLVNNEFDSNNLSNNITPVIEQIESMTCEMRFNPCSSTLSVVDSLFAACGSVDSISSVRGFNTGSS